jgi:hypothetical protein
LAWDSRISRRAVLEALAAEAYSKEVLSLELDLLWEAQAMLYGPTNRQRKS